MKIELGGVPIRDLVIGYANRKEEGVTGYDGALNIRPAYQREFVYKDAQRDAVIHTVRHNRPLNVMYWAVVSDGGYEVLDGQQRTLSICEYVTGGFAIDHQFFFNLSPEEQEQILDYTLMVYTCSGTDREKMEWFETVNIAGVELTKQELRNVAYAGPFVSDARRYFSKPNCPAKEAYEGYLKGSMIRQDYLQTALSWAGKGKIEGYMSEHQHEPNARHLWIYFQNVMTWVKETFVVYRRECKGVDFGALYDAYKDERLDPKELEDEISRLMADEDVTSKSGIYTYVLTRDLRHLSIRKFTDRQKREAFERQKGGCPSCGKVFAIEDMEADHITPWHEGGQTIVENCRALCKGCNRRKSGS